MRIEDCEIGKRVYCPEKFYGIEGFGGQYGTIVFVDYYNDSQEVRVEWDNPVKSFCTRRGHDCGGHATSGHGYNGRAEDLEPAVIFESPAKFCCDIKNII